MYRSLLDAIDFAARAHRYQRRKDHGEIPYVNHAIEVAELVARVGEVEDLEVLQAAVLHDTVEDTEVTLEQIEERYGEGVRDLVDEMTDDKSLVKAERKQAQIDESPAMSHRGKIIKLADKISNVRDIAHRPPPDWTLDRRRAYVQWAVDVVAGIRGTNEGLERTFDEVVDEARSVIG